MAKHKVKRYDGEDGSMVEDDAMEMANKGENLDTAPGPVATPAKQTKAPIVTKEALAKSGLSLRDYLNKQQGLTRRGEEKFSAATVSGPGRSTTPPTPPKATYETPYDRMNRKNAEQSAAKDQYGASTRAETARLAKKSSGAMDPNTLLPKRMAKGGSVSSASSRADGIAQRGKTRGVMLCGGGMAKGKR
jgi:hypothetical protein